MNIRRASKIKFILDTEKETSCKVFIEGLDDCPDDDPRIKKILLELEQSTDLELDNLYKQAQAKAAQVHFLYKPDLDANFDLWGKRPYWTVEEATALYFSKDPEQVNSNVALRYSSHIPFTKQYLDIFKLLKSAIGQWKQGDYHITNKTSPISFIKWGEYYNLPFPEELCAIVERYTIDNEEKPLDPRERESLLKMFIGMASSVYSKEALLSNEATASEIQRDLAKIGIKTTDDTVRKFLNLSIKYLPKKPVTPKETITS